MNTTNSLNKPKISGRRCAMPLTLALMTIFTFCVNSGCSSARREIVLVNDSQKIKTLDVNEPAPFRGILITQGYFEYLLDLEGMTK